MSVQIRPAVIDDLPALRKLRLSPQYETMPI